MAGTAATAWNADALCCPHDAHTLWSVRRGVWESLCRERIGAGSTQANVLQRLRQPPWTHRCTHDTYAGSSTQVDTAHCTLGSSGPQLLRSSPLGTGRAPRCAPGSSAQQRKGSELRFRSSKRTQQGSSLRTRWWSLHSVNMWGQGRKKSGLFVGKSRSPCQHTTMGHEPAKQRSTATMEGFHGDGVIVGRCPREEKA